MIKTKTPYRLGIALTTALGLSSITCGMFEKNENFDRILKEADSFSSYDPSQISTLPNTLLNYREIAKLLYTSTMDMRESDASHIPMRNALLLKLNGGVIPSSLEETFYMVDDYKGSRAAGWSIVTESADKPLLEVAASYDLNSADIHGTPRLRTLDVLQRVFEQGDLVADQLTYFVPNSTIGYLRQQEQKHDDEIILQGLTDEERTRLRITSWVTSFSDYKMYDKNGQVVGRGSTSNPLNPLEIATLGKATTNMMVRSQSDERRRNFEKPYESEREIPVIFNEPPVLELADSSK